MDTIDTRSGRRSRLRPTARALLASVALASAAATGGTPLDPDPGYGGGAGRVNFSLGARDATLGPSLVQADGKLLVTGFRTRASASEGLQFDAFIRRYHGDGSPDETFGDEGTVHLTMAERAIEQITLQPDGKILLGVWGWWPCPPGDPKCLVNPILGEYTDEQTGFGIVRLLGDGTPDTAFGSAGAMTIEPPDDDIAALAVQPDGKILALSRDGYLRPGDLAHGPARYRWKVSRFNADGSPDTGFNGAQPLESRCDDMRAVVPSLALQADGGFVVAGLGHDNPRSYCIERRLGDGRPDQGFNGGNLWTAMLTRAEVEFDTIEVLTDGKLLMVGRGLDYSGSTMQSGVVAARCAADGTPDPAFGTGGAAFLPVTADPWAYMQIGIVSARDGGFAAAGYEYDYQSDNASQFVPVLLKVGPRGDPDPAFGENGIARQSPGGDVPRAFVRDIEDRWLLVSSTASGPALAKGTIARYLGERPDAVPAIEFYNGPLRHYFLTASTTEAAGIDAGAAGPGWWRTGAVIPAFLPLAADTLAGLPQAARPLCRFYGTPGAGPNSHFYTISEAECAKVRQDPGWSFEHYAFAAYPGIVIDGEAGCAEGLQPVWRLYNNRFAQNDSNHRYTTSESIRRQMKNIGWIDEGIAFCAATE